MYTSGTYTVTWETGSGEYHVSQVFETEQEARAFGNRVWKDTNVKEVEINRRQFHHKRRHSVVIAKAKKNKKRTTPNEDQS